MAVKATACMFKALSLLEYGTEKHFQEARAMIMEVVEIETDFLKAYVVDETLAERVTRLKNPGEWGEHPELHAANLLYKRKIEIDILLKINFAFVFSLPRNGFSHSNKNQFLRKSIFV